MNLEKIRRKIDVIDQKILILLARRRNLAQKTAVIKRKNNFPVKDPAREKAIIDTLTEKAERCGLEGKFIARLFQMIIRESRRRQKT